jgi:phosphoglycerate dehydrogenase-like enzyme
MKIIYTQRTQLDRATEQALNVEYRDMDSLLRESDWLVPQLPSTPSTEGLLDAEKLSKIKQGARLVNVSRAQIMDRNAVLAALERGALGGFALDTLWSEPGSDDDQLLSFPNVILTPHMAGSPRHNATADFEEMIVGLDEALSPRAAQYS